MAVGRFNAIINEQLRLGIKIRSDQTGELFDPFQITKVEIIDSDTETVLETITENISRNSVGYYEILTQNHAIWNTEARSIIDKWFFIPNTGSFEIAIANSTVINNFSAGTEDFPTPDVIKNTFLKGLTLTDKNGDEMSDTEVQRFINSAIATLEKKLGVDIIERKVVCNPEEGEDFDIAEDPYDYKINDYMNWGNLILFRKPVKEVNRVEWVYPTGQKILELPLEWIKIKKRHAQMNVIPTAGTLSQVIVGQGGQYLPMLSAGYIGNLPSMIHVDYTTGFDVIPDDIWEAIGRIASISVLEIMSDAIAQGIASESISADGLSTSLSRTAQANALLYQARIDSYKKWLKEFYDLNRDFYHGPGLTII